MPYDSGPFGGEDAAWLHMEDETNPMVVTGLLELGGVLDVSRLTELVGRHVATLPRFRSLVAEHRRGVGLPRWELDPHFDVSRHIEHVTLEAGDAALSDFIGEQVGELLDCSRPLWRLWVLDRPGLGTALLCRIHHAIADGFALMTVLLGLCDEHTPERARGVATHGASVSGVVRQAASLKRLVTLPRDPRTVLKGPLTREKRVAWSAPLSLPRVKRLARAASATVNDVLVAVVAGALRGHLVARGEDVPEVRAMVPVNLRDPSQVAGLGNRFGLVLLGLPVGLADPTARLSETKRRMDRLKSSPEAIVSMGLLSVMGWAPRGVERLGVAFFGMKSSLVLTNVPGPRERLHIAGVPLSRLVFWVPQSGRMGLGISIFSYADEVTLGVLSDASLIKEPRALVERLERELDLLEQAIMARPSPHTASAQ